MFNLKILKVAVYEKKEDCGNNLPVVSTHSRGSDKPNLRGTMEQQKRTTNYLSLLQGVSTLLQRYPAGQTSKQGPAIAYKIVGLSLHLARVANKPPAIALGFSL